MPDKTVKEVGITLTEENKQDMIEFIDNSKCYLFTVEWNNYDSLSYL